MALSSHAATHSRVVQLTRIKQELADFEKNPRGYIVEIKKVHKCRQIFQFKFRGDGAILKNAIIPITMDASLDYPFKAPLVKFVLPFYHPNVDPLTNELCSSQLTQENWKPETTMEEILINTMCLINEPDVSRPVNFQAAEDYIHQREKYDSIQKEMARKMV